MGKKKAQNGRAKQKQKAKGNSSTPRTPRANYAQQMLADDDWGEDTPLQFRGFAQNSPSSSFAPRSAQASGKLRHQAPISFVSAGVNAPLLPTPRNSNGDIALDDSDDDEEDDDEDIDDSAIHTNMIEQDIEISEHGMAKMHIETTQMDVEEDIVIASTSHVEINGAGRIPVPQSAESAMENLFVVDTIGDESLTAKAKANGKRHMKRVPSPARSDSSEEVVVFHGRNRPTVVNDPFMQASHSKRAAPHVTDDLLNALASTSNPSAQMSNLSLRPQRTQQQPNDAWEPAPDIPYWRKQKGKRRPDLAPSAADVEVLKESLARTPKVQFSESKEPEKSAEDTITSLQADWKKTLRNKRAQRNEVQEYASTESSKSSKSSKRKGKRGRKQDNRAIRAPITNDDSAEDSEAAYDDYMENLRTQLDGTVEDEEALLASLQASSRFPPAMVVDGEEFGDDQLLSKDKKDIVEESGDGYKINTDSDWTDEEDSDLPNPDLDELSSDGSDLELELEYAEQEQWEDELDLRERRIERMSDEHMARLFEKQRQLGLDSDEIILEDGLFSDDGYGDLDAARKGLSDLTNSSFGRSVPKHGIRRHRGGRDENFPDASIMADVLDQYGENGFDIMDYDRPSLKAKRKGRKGKLPEELDMLSDEDLKEDLRDQWENDRYKKAQKKAEREELRREGLLGSAGRKGKADLGQKYALGMTIHEVHDELRDFLQNEELRERSFPPMGKADRKSLHEIAVALILNSKSQGAGKKRFTIVYKTSRTPTYDRSMFDEVMRVATRGFLTNAKANRLAKRSIRGGGGMSSRGGRGGGMAAAGIRHGELVGAGAPEISSNSFGHKMMEKMGWSKGTALGKDRDGLLVPVEQRMRVGTAGLG